MSRMMGNYHVRFTCEVISFYIPTLTIWISCRPAILASAMVDRSISRSSKSALCISFYSSRNF